MGPLVIGIGNPLRGDDAVGLRVVELLGFSDTVVACDGEPASLIARWEGQTEVILVDAVTAGESPGTVVEVDLVESAVPAAMCHSTHAMGPAEAVELARALGKLPARMILFGIEGADFSFGAGLSPLMESAAVEVVGRIRSRLAQPLD